ncbi:MAG TPA: DUF4395 domain-containing protein [Ilumatobacter sp.]|nr:DUF4395 domain-containing protein [Ilumatobacter sp.]
MFRQLFRFPDPVNETSARLVAAGVVVQAVLFLAFQSGWVLVPLTYGFAARVLTGPTLSPLGQLATRVVTPRLPVTHRFVPGPPKRFAQGVGLAFTAGASVAWLLGAPVVAYVLIGFLVVAATLESVFAICLGCIVYRFFWDCAECNDITERMQRALARQEAGAATS